VNVSISVERTRLNDRIAPRWHALVKNCSSFIKEPLGVFCARMRCRDVVLLIAVITGGVASNTSSAESNWAGEYADNTFLEGQAAFHISIEQSENVVQVSFDAAYADAHGAAPDGQGSGKITGKNTLQFNWEDSFNNSGTGTIKRTADGIVVSMKTTRVMDSRCLVFYGENMRLNRVK
jgi:hypothetical protein